MPTGAISAAPLSEEPGLCSGFPTLLFGLAMRCMTLVVFTLLIGLGPSACSDEPEHDRSAELSAAIDQAVQLSLEKQGIKPAAAASEQQYLRRVTLDLAGRIPTTAETKEYLVDNDPQKRVRLIDRLLASADFAFHQRNELDILLLARLQWNNDWRDYLLQAAREHRGWDQLIREVLLPEKMRPEDQGAAAFLKQRAKDLDAMTNDTSTLLFGVNIACAKCHDHPLVYDWQQDHYFGFASFFKRTIATRRGMLAERFEGDLKFKTTAGEEKQAELMFLDGTRVEETLVSRSDDEWKEIREKFKQAERDDKADPPPSPPFSPREKLVEIALGGEGQPLVARNLANRLWARFMGHGLVHPLDQMHSENPPSHPDLLDRLTEALIRSDYDMRPLIRAIVLSNVYGRSSQWSGDELRPLPERFAVQVPRPLTPLQYSLSLWIAVRRPDALPGAEKPEDWFTQREQWEKRSEGLARKFEIPEEHFQISAEEALLLSNSQQIEGEYLRIENDTLLGYLKSLDDRGEKIRAAFTAVLARDPEEAEVAMVEQHLATRSDRDEAALQQVVWALLTSAEFRFNH
jgi:hypothetical protein